MPRPKKRYYLDTSVWNYLSYDPRPDRVEPTKHFFGLAARGAFEIYSSALVVREVMRTNSPERRQFLLDQLRHFQPLEVPLSPEAATLAEIYVRLGAVPTKEEDDALHLALATVNGLDAVISWNMKHMANADTQEAVEAANMRYGYHPLRIWTPEQVVK